MQMPLARLQEILHAPQETVGVKGRAMPTVGGRVSDAERSLLKARGLVKR
jgi:hypothetical protein